MPPASRPVAVQERSDVAPVGSGGMDLVKPDHGSEPSVAAPKSTRERSHWLLVFGLLAVFVSGWGIGSRKTPEIVTRTVTVPAPPTVEYRPAHSDDRGQMESVAIAFLHAWLTRGTGEVRRRALSDLASPPIVNRLVQEGDGYLPSGRPFGPPSASVADRVTGTGHYWTALTDGHTVGLNLAFRDGQWVVTDLQG